jgi:hypothetical protein
MFQPEYRNTKEEQKMKAYRKPKQIWKYHLYKETEISES